jgi:aminoglycoside/choline kinase family phosphotransferase
MRDDPNAREEPSLEDEEFARQLAAVLRASEEHPSSDFDDRVMAAVRAVHALTPVTPISAWRRERSLSLPPMAWGALAAGFAVIVSLGTLATAHILHDREPTAAVAAAAPTRQAPAAEPAPVAPAAIAQPVPAHVARARRDTVYMVRFVLADAGAHTVSLVGDFNEWEKRANPLTPDKPGVWSTQVALTPGRHEYAFVVDGKRWVADPSAEHVADEFDTPSSVVTVGRDGMGGI